MMISPRNIEKSEVFFIITVVALSALMPGLFPLHSSNISKLLSSYLNWCSLRKSSASKQSYPLKSVPKIRSRVRQSFTVKQDMCGLFLPLLTELTIRVSNHAILMPMVMYSFHVCYSFSSRTVGSIP